METSIWVYAITYGSRVNGPGRRNILHLSGCSIRCPGCFSKHTWERKSGTEYPVTEVLRQLLLHDPEGVSISGGEPLEQASGILQLLQLLPDLPKGILMFTGTNTVDRLYIPEWSGIRAKLDVAIAGPYVAGDSTQPVMGLVSSPNQRVFNYTDKISAAELLASPQVEIIVGADGMRLLGFPGELNVRNTRNSFAISSGPKGSGRSAEDDVPC